MRYIQHFEKHKASKKLSEIIKESVMQVDDISKVRAVADIPQSLINNVVKRCKDVSGKNIRQFFSDSDIAEEIVKYALNSINSDTVSTVPFIGGEGQSQAQPQSQAQAQSQSQAQSQAQAQPQSQAQPQAQPQAQAQAQPQEDESQVQAQVQSQGQANDSDFEEVQPQSSEEEEEEEEDNEELPI